jgi:hypothetical protein
VDGEWQEPGHVNAGEVLDPELVLGRDSLREEPAGKLAIPADGVWRERPLNGQPVPVFGRTRRAASSRLLGSGSATPTLRK